MTLGTHSRNGAYQTLREQVADAIRHLIIRNEMKPGERISEPELARRFSISRTPVREALRQLDSEGFLEVIPRRGARVGKFSVQDIHEFYEVKSLLEGYAARLAVPRMTDREIQRLRQLHEQMVRHHQHGEYQKIHRLHRAFHEMIVQGSGNEQLISLLQTLGSRFQRFSIQIALSGRNGEAFRQHLCIVEAFEARSPDEAERWVKANALLGRGLMIQETALPEEKSLETS